MCDVTSYVDTSYSGFEAKAPKVVPGFAARTEQMKKCVTAEGSVMEVLLQLWAEHVTEVLHLDEKFVLKILKDSIYRQNIDFKNAQVPPSQEW